MHTFWRSRKLLPILAVSLAVRLLAIASVFWRATRIKKEAAAEILA